MCLVLFPAERVMGVEARGAPKAQVRLHAAPTRRAGGGSKSHEAGVCDRRQPQHGGDVRGRVR